MMYYFNYRDSSRFVEDIEGSELNSIEDVREEARDGAREMIAKWFKASTPIDIDSSFEVVTENGTLVHVLPFAKIILGSLIKREVSPA